MIDGCYPGNLKISHLLDSTLTSLKPKHRAGEFDTRKKDSYIGVFLLLVQHGWKHAVPFT